MGRLQRLQLLHLLPECRQLAGQPELLVVQGGRLGHEGVEPGGLVARRGLDFLELLLQLVPTRHCGGQLLFRLGERSLGEHLGGLQLHDPLLGRLGLGGAGLQGLVDFFVGCFQDGELLAQRGELLRRLVVLGLQLAGALAEQPLEFGHGPRMGGCLLLQGGNGGQGGGQFRGLGLHLLLQPALLRRQGGQLRRLFLAGAAERLGLLLLPGQGSLGRFQSRLRLAELLFEGFHLAAAVGELLLQRGCGCGLFTGGLFGQGQFVGGGLQAGAGLVELLFEGLDLAVAGSEPLLQGGGRFRPFVGRLPGLGQFPVGRLQSRRGRVELLFEGGHGLVAGGEPLLQGDRGRGLVGAVLPDLGQFLGGGLQVGGCLVQLLLEPFGGVGMFVELLPEVCPGCLLLFAQLLFRRFAGRLLFVQGRLQLCGPGPGGRQFFGEFVLAGGQGADPLVGRGELPVPTGDLGLGPLAHLPVPGGDRLLGVDQLADLPVLVGQFLLQGLEPGGEFRRRCRLPGCCSLRQERRHLRRGGCRVVLFRLGRGCVLLRRRALCRLRGRHRGRLMVAGRRRVLE